MIGFRIQNPSVGSRPFDRRNQPQRVDQGAPAFDAVWKKIQDQSIDANSWKLMRDWLASESRQGRRWRIRGQSSIIRPGFTVIVAPSDCDPSQAIPELQASISLYSQPERFRILPDGLERVPRDSWPEIRKMTSEHSEFRDFLKDAPFPEDSFSELKGVQARSALLDGEIVFEMGVGIESLVWMGPER